MSVAIEMGLERLLGSVRSYGVAALTVFKHSYNACVAAETIKAMSPARIPHAFAATALLHDVGEIILSHHLDTTDGPSLEEIRHGRLGEVEAERAELDLDHAEVSALMCRQWRMPQRIVQGVQHHHSPWVLDEPLSYAVSLADQLALCIDAPQFSAATADSLLVGRSLGELGLAQSDMTTLIDETGRRLAERGRTP